MSAGAFGTPHILQLSGIGDPEVLQSAGIEPVVDLPSVGKNLTDQPQFTTIWPLGITHTFDPYVGSHFPVIVALIPEINIGISQDAGISSTVVSPMARKSNWTAHERWSEFYRLHPYPRFLAHLEQPL